MMTGAHGQFWRKDLAPGSRLPGGRVGKYAWPEPEREATGRGRGQQGGLRAPPDGDEWLFDRAMRGQTSQRSHTNIDGLIFSKLGPHPFLDSPLEMSLS